MPAPALIAVIALFLRTSPAVAASDAIFMRTMPGGSVELSNIPDDGSYALLVSAPSAADAASDAEPVPATPTAAARSAPLERGVAKYRELVAAVARQAAVDARLVHAVIAVESGYDPNAVSRKGAVGLMQLMPGTARRYGVDDARDPRQNILGGASYLRDLLKLFNDDIPLALAAYNAGENAVRRHGNRIPRLDETVSYVPKVMEAYRRLEGLLL